MLQLILVFFAVLSIPKVIISHQPHRVAIIGAGIGGSSVSHYLSEEFPDSEINLFEKEIEAGGRTNHYKLADGVIIEMGASFFIEANKHIIELAKIYNCKYSSSINPKEIMGLWNGKAFVFETSSNKYITLLKMFWRYRLTPFYFFKQNSKMIEDFMKIYENSTFHNYSEFLSIVQAEKYLNITIYDYLIKENYNLDFINEFIAGVISGIYNQAFTRINAFAGMISLAGANNKAFSFEGGNRECIKKIINNNKKVNFSTLSFVKKIFRNNSHYSLLIQENDGSTKVDENYDFVIIASPMKNIELQLNESFSIKNVTYVKAFVHLIAGKIKCAYFDNAIQENECLGTLMSVDLNASNVADYSRKCKECYELNKEKVDIYKFQTTKNLSNEEWGNIFLDGKYKIIDFKEWDAYPDLTTVNVTDLNNIMIEEGLYFLNGMESLASCMEMEIISGKNIVKLIVEKENEKNKNETESILSNTENLETEESNYEEF